ncbi:MAG: hypothetical protein ACTSUB_08995 [Candidatus Thorarchaeota archaeon]
MSKSRKKSVQATSTVEAIKMASATILGTTTSRGYPVGSATGSGTMLEQNSELVAMNITPLIFAVRDAIKGAEGLELLSLEWNLEHKQGSEILPEHLVVAGRSIGDVASHLCTVSWERGVVDPFRIDDYVKVVAKKLSDIEKAVIGNEFDYDTDGMEIIRKFSDRLNKVTFVEMLDRQFHADYQSVQIKPEHTDIEAVLKMQFIDDFTTNPPGPRILGRKSIVFSLPIGDEASRLEHFKQRVYSPNGLMTLGVRIPEVGRAIMSELNTYAYSIEEVDIARATIALFVKYLGREEIFPEELEDIRGRITEFVDWMTQAVDIFAEVIATHTKSGAKLTLDGHQESLHSQISERASEVEELGLLYMKALVEHLMGSIRREFPVEGEIRAWQMRSFFSYFSTFSKRVISYFSDEMYQFLLSASVKKLLLSTLQSFREELIAEGLDPTDSMLFHKFYSELYSLINAIIDRVQFEGSKQDSIEGLITTISRDTMDAFSQIDIWNLIDFTDLSEIAKREIKTRYSSEGETLSEKGESMVNLLVFFELFVTETLPDVGDTLLSKSVLNPIIDKVVGGSDLIEELRNTVAQETEKPMEWKNEILSWIEEIATNTSEMTSLSEKLLSILNTSYARLGKGASAQSIVEKVKSVVAVYEVELERKMKLWGEECSIIDKENEPLQESNKRRAELLTQSKAEYENDLVIFQKKVAEFQERQSAMSAETDSIGAVSPTSPTEPESLENRRVKIYGQYPMRDEKPHPPKPEPSSEMANYIDLRDLLDEKFENLISKQEQMEKLFAERLKVLRLEGESMAKGVSIGLATDFLEYLMNSVIRKLARLLPRATRAYLRHPDNPDLIYLVTFEHIGEELSISIGNNLLRRK